MKKLIIIVFVVLCISCNKHSDVVVIISANAEWKAFSMIIKPDDAKYNMTPYGAWFRCNINGADVIFFHGGWGKIDAAASAQYAIDKFNPELLINLGTAGGFPGTVKKGDVVLVNRAITYDIYEKMGDSEEAIGYYTSSLHVPELTKNDDIKISSIVSADQDLAPEKIAVLHKKYGACAGDWESSAIAHVAKKNKVPCYIMRGITDIVYHSGSNTYGNFNEFEKETAIVMKKLVYYLKIILKNESTARYE